MYLTDFLAINSGPLEDLHIRPAFNADGLPKPLILVGGNGAGKTNVLSIVADALFELANKHFADISPRQGHGHSFYRLLGSATIRVGAQFELTAVRFEHNGMPFGCRSKLGAAEPAAFAGRFNFYPEMGQWPDGGDKSTFGDTGQVEQIYRNGCYTFFPSNRAEAPSWLNTGAFEIDPPVRFDMDVKDRLRKPITSSSQFEALKPWIIDVILDQSIDATHVIRLLLANQENPANQIQAIANISGNAQTLQNLNAVISAIVKDPTARIVRAGRAANERKIMIVKGDSVLVPTLEGLSSGQSTLLAMFGTIARYGDMGAASMPNAQMEGVVLIDEIDAHLHADLQHEALPKLIAMFPRIQFIVTTHAPLFLVGMEKQFGEDGITILEVPSGIQLTAERFSEFEHSLRLLQATNAFEQRVRDMANAAARPLVLCEGETDPKYLRTAAELHGYTELAAGVDFDWIGQRGIDGADEGGKSNLNNAFKVLRHNPIFVRAPTVLFYDSDARKPDEDTGQLHIRSMTRNDANNICPGGVENLLPEAAMEDRFYNQTTTRNGTKTVTIRDIRKVELCNYLCDEQRAPDTFAGFKPSLDLLCGLLGFQIPPVPAITEE